MNLLEKWQTNNHDQKLQTTEFLGIIIIKSISFPRHVVRLPRQTAYFHSFFSGFLKLLSTVTFSQHHFYEVNQVRYLTYFSYFYKVEEVLFSKFCCSTFIKLNEFCFLAFAVGLL